MSDIAFIQYSSLAKQEVKHKFNSYQKEFKASERATRITNSIDTFFGSAIFISFIVQLICVDIVVDWTYYLAGDGDYGDLIFITLLFLPGLVVFGLLWILARFMTQSIRRAILEEDLLLFCYINETREKLASYLIHPNPLQLKQASRYFKKYTDKMFRSKAGDSLISIEKLKNAQEDYFWFIPEKDTGKIMESLSKVNDAFEKVIHTKTNLDHMIKILDVLCVYNYILLDQTIDVPTSKEFGRQTLLQLGPAMEEVKFPEETADENTPKVSSLQKIQKAYSRFTVLKFIVDFLFYGALLGCIALLLIRFFGNEHQTLILAIIATAGAGAFSLIYKRKS